MILAIAIVIFIVWAYWAGWDDHKAQTQVDDLCKRIDILARRGTE